MSLTVAIHQPEYFPWLGFVDKARRVDVLVLLDTVQFDRSSLQHRARVLGPNGPVWLTIPFVHRFPQRIDEVAIAEDRYRTKHWKSLQACYGRAPGFAGAAPPLEAFFGEHRARLVDVSVESVRIVLGAFEVKVPRVVRASELEARGEKGELVMAICRELGAARYLSGRTGATYLDASAFDAAGIELVVQRFTPPPYPHLRPVTPEELGGVSALDAWFNLGREAPGWLRATDKETS